MIPNFLYPLPNPLNDTLGLVISNQKSCSSGKINFRVIFLLVAPRITPFAFEDSPINAGEYTTIQCAVPNGDLPINVEWKFNGNSLKQYSEITISKAGRRGSLLTIESVSHNLAGNYTCIASNKAGSYQHTAELLVNG